MEVGAHMRRQGTCVPLYCPSPASLCPITCACVTVSSSLSHFPSNSNKIKRHTSSIIEICCCYGNSQQFSASGNTLLE